ncbi:unnamed protein product [Closterium sp. NIES-54]
MWLDDLQLYLLSDSRDLVSLFDHTSGATPAPPTTADSATRSQWLTRDAAARLAIRNHLLLAECAHFGQHRRAQALYDTVVARYSSPATAALGRLQLPYMFPELSAFATNPPPMYITLYFIVTRLPDSLRAVRDHFLALDPTTLTVDLLKQNLLAAETSVVAVGAARGTHCTPFFEGCSPSPLAPSYASAAAVDVLGAEDVRVASGSGKRRSSKGKGGRGGGGGSGGGGGGSSGGGGDLEVVAAVGVVAGVGALVAVVEAAVRVAVVAAVGAVVVGLELSVEVLEEAKGSGSSVEARPRRLSSFVSGSFSVGHLGIVSGVAIFDLDFDAILFAMYALSASAEGDCYRYVPPHPGIEAAALGAGESSLPGTAPVEALHTFTLDSGASRYFFRDSTTLTPLPAPVPIRLADPSWGPVVAHSSTVLPCPTVPSGSRSGLHLPSFSTNLVSTAAQDSMVTTTTPTGHHVSICTCTRKGRHLATFTRQPGSSLYTLATEPPQVVASAQVSASGQVAPPCSCRLLSHPTLLWNHHQGHPSLPSLPPPPPSPATPFLPCVKGWQRAAPHSSSFPPTTAPLQTLHMDVWGPARVSGQGRERYFLLVVDDYTWYTTVFPLRSKGQDLPVLRLHSDRGGEFSSDLLRDFCRGEGVLQSFTLSDSPQQNGIAERHIGLVMEVARTSMIHAAALHFLWPFAVRYAAHQLNLWPRVSLPKTSPTLRWTGKVGNASVFQVWGSRAFVRYTSTDKLSTRAIPCVFLGFSPDAPGWQFYHPTSRHVFLSEDVTFEESVPFYCLFPYCSAPPPPLLFFLAPSPPPVDPLPSTVPVEVAGDSGAARGAGSGGAETGGAEYEGAGSGGVEPGGVEPEGVEPGGADLEGAESWGTGDAGAGVTAGAGGTGGTAAAGPGGACTRVPGAAGTSGVRGAGAGDPTEPGAAGVGGAGAGGTGAGGASSVGAGAVGAGARGTGPGGAGVGGAGAVDLGAGGVSSSTGLPPPLLCPPPDQSQPSFQPASPLPAPSPYTEQSGGLKERRELASRPVPPVRTGRRVPRPRPLPVPGTHAMAIRPSSVLLRVPLPPPLESSLPAILDLESECAHTASPTVSCLFATVVTDPSFESTAAIALVAELLDFAAACRLDYATTLVAESQSASPPSIGGECALGTDVLEDRQEDFECLVAAMPHFASMLLAPEGDPNAPDIPTLHSYAEAITGPYSSEWQAAMDAEMASSKFTGTYVEAVPPS